MICETITKPNGRGAKFYTSWSLQFSLNLTHAIATIISDMALGIVFLPVPEIDGMCDPDEFFVYVSFQLNRVLVNGDRGGLFAKNSFMLLMELVYVYFLVISFNHMLIVTNRFYHRMASNRGQGGIQQLLAAEQEAQRIVNAAKNEKLARLKQAKEEAEKEIAEYRAQLEYEFQKKVTESGGDSGANVKRLEQETEVKIQHLKTEAARISEEVVTMLLKYVTSVKN
ncbi:hypothetical protein VNO78_17661 [Psophocarpus tetragonolobus]|uniref:V-type proton ATPase subunit G n=1 Tax=Psophocarpus tetragonolobus TaxID=3891 RepID=A0AAN9XKU4_PSOTE